PRFRYDQVMDLGWKLMLPASLVIVVVTAGTILALDGAGVEYGLVYGLVLAVVNFAMLAAVLLVLDRGRILAGSYSGRAKREHARVVAEFHQAERGSPSASQPHTSPGRG